MLSIRYTKDVSIEANFWFSFIYDNLEKTGLLLNFTLSSKKILRNLCEVTQII